MDYTGKTIWIIGASSGIGRALAYELDRRGAALLLSARRQNELDHLLSELKGPHRAFAVDVADLSGMMNAVEHAKHICHKSTVSCKWQPSTIQARFRKWILRQPVKSLMSI